MNDLTDLLEQGAAGPRSTYTSADVATGAVRRRRRRRLAGVGAVVALVALGAGLVAALRDDPTSRVDVASPGFTAEELVGRWVAIQVTSVDEPLPLLPTLDFEPEGTVGGNTGCNLFGGHYELADGTLSVSEIESTAMLCSDVAGRLESGLMDALRGGAPLTPLGANSFSLADGPVTVTFARLDSLVVPTAADLAGAWQVGGETITIGRTVETSGCGSLGTWRRARERLDIDGLTQDRSLCLDRRSSRLGEVLLQDPTVHLAGPDTLVLAGLDYVVRLTGTEPECADEYTPHFPGSSAAFVVELPDGRQGGNPGDNGWRVQVTVGEPVVLTITADVSPRVELDPFNYVVRRSGLPGEGTDVRHFTAQDGNTTIVWDGTNDDGGRVAPGPYRFMAEATIARDLRHACESNAGAFEAWGLGHFDVGE